jgi:lipopolysaccharide/colanic/teichoic acid biosynthesis glycosyltransferase
MIELDLGYVRSWSLFGDLVILVKTFFVVLWGHGAY